MFFLASHGYRSIARERRGHGLKNVIHRPLNWRWRSRPLYRSLWYERIAKAVLIGAAPRVMLKTEGQPRRAVNRGVRATAR